MTSERTVHILRHAHSSWAVPGQRDHQRVLDDRGRADAVRVAEEAHAIGSRVGMVVCSTAVRARQTLDLLRRALPQDVAVRFSDELYALGRAAYVGEIDAFAGPGELLLVGHNPTIDDLALHLCEGDETSQRLLQSGVGTSNWLTIDLNAGTSQRGRLRVLLKP